MVSDSYIHIVLERRADLWNNVGHKLNSLYPRAGKCFAIVYKVKCVEVAFL
jgi:hypothetical protein